MIEIANCNPNLDYSLLLGGGGAITGTLIYPPTVQRESYWGGRKVIHSQTIPKISRQCLHFFILDVGTNVYEVLVPVEEIIAIFPLAAVDEPLIESASDPNWKALGQGRTWESSLARTLALASALTVRKRGYKFRPVLEIGMMQSSPHPMSFPRYATFRPTGAQVLYLDPEVLADHLASFQQEDLIRLFTPVVALEQLPKTTASDGLLCVRGAMGFFEPPQQLAWRGMTGELVAITSTAFVEGRLGDDWQLGFVRPNGFPIFRESLERIAGTYTILGKWQELGPFHSEYGSRRYAFVVGAAVYGAKEASGLRHAVESASGWLSRHTPRYRGIGTASGNSPKDPQNPPATLLCFDPSENSIILGDQLYSVSKEGFRLLKGFALERLHDGLSCSINMGSPKPLGNVTELKESLPSNIRRLIEFDRQNKRWRLSASVRLPRVFVSYASEDRRDVERLVTDVGRACFDPWWDRRLKAGQNWELEVEELLRSADFVIVCFSHNLTHRVASGVYPELGRAIENLRTRKPGMSYLFLAKVSDCEIPALKTFGANTLKDLHHVTLYPTNRWQQGLAAIIGAMWSQIKKRVQDRA